MFRVTNHDLILQFNVYSPSIAVRQNCTYYKYSEEPAVLLFGVNKNFVYYVTIFILLPLIRRFPALATSDGNHE
jgi:hypothetical protein